MTGNINYAPQCPLQLNGHCRKELLVATYSDFVSQIVRGLLESI